MNVKKLGLAMALVAGLGISAVAHAVQFVFDTALVSMTLTANNVAMPLGTGYQSVASDVVLTLSSQRAGTPGPATLGLTTATEQGASFAVTSFFDVFFDIIFTDADPVNDYAVGAGQFTFLDNGPAQITTSYNAALQPDAFLLGLLPPPESAPYAGSFNVEIPLGGDINGNGQNDKIKFSSIAITFADADRTFIGLPDGTVIFQVDASAVIQGAVGDVNTDPPFEIGRLVGPTTGTARLQNPTVPEPATLALLGLGLAGLGFSRRRIS